MCVCVRVCILDNFCMKLDQNKEIIEDNKKKKKTITDKMNFISGFNKKCLNIRLLFKYILYIRPIMFEYLSFFFLLISGF